MTRAKIRAGFIAGALAFLLAIAGGFIATGLAAPAPAGASPDSTTETGNSPLVEGLETHEEPLPADLDLRRAFGDLIPIQVFS